MIDFSNFNSLIQVTDYFTTDTICKQTIAEARWADGKAVCPYCGCNHCYVDSKGRYICNHCKGKFNVTVGTIFENTKVSLRKWFIAMYLVSSHKKGVSSCQLARDIKVTQKTAWFLLHKIRGLYGQSDTTVLSDEVEVDEMYLGGRESNKHDSKRTEGTQGRSTKTKTPIFGMVERGGKVVAMKVENSQSATLHPIIGQFVADGTKIYTDEYIGYKSLSNKGYEHEFVNHKQREFVRASDIHTNSIEGFWAHFKRVVFSTYHMVSKDYLQRYIDEQVYRWNTREEEACVRFADMFKNAIGVFDYADVLSLSNVVSIERFYAKRAMYYQMWKQHHMCA